MTMPSNIRKLTLTLHVTVTVGWLGAVLCFLILANTGLASKDAQTVRSAYLAMELITKFVIVPLSIASLMTGLVQSLGTKWGLFRYYWILVKLILTIIAIIVLLLQLEPISYIASISADTAFSSADLREARTSLVIHAGGGLLVLLLAITLSVYKPRGVTRYGWRKQKEQRIGS